MKCTQFTSHRNGYKELVLELDHIELQQIVNCMHKSLVEHGEYSKDAEYWELYLQIADILSFIETGNRGDILTRKTILEKIKEIEEAEKEKLFEEMNNG